jgi:hypothetical protein
MQVGYGANKTSKRSKRYQNPAYNRVRHNPVTFAKMLLEKHTQKEAQAIASNNVAGLLKTISDGTPADWTNGREIRINLGFWKSVAGFLNRYPKKLEK